MVTHATSTKKVKKFVLLPLPFKAHHTHLDLHMSEGLHVPIFVPVCPFALECKSNRQRALLFSFLWRWEISTLTGFIGNSDGFEKKRYEELNEVYNVSFCHFFFFVDAGVILWQDLFGSFVNSKKKKRGIWKIERMIYFTLRFFGGKKRIISRFIFPVFFLEGVWPLSNLLLGDLNKKVNAFWCLIMGTSWSINSRETSVKKKGKKTQRK